MAENIKQKNTKTENAKPEKASEEDDFDRGWVFGQLMFPLLHQNGCIVEDNESADVGFLQERIVLKVRSKVL